MKHFNSCHTVSLPLKGVTAKCDWNSKATSESLTSRENREAKTLMNVQIQT